MNLKEIHDAWDQDAPFDITKLDEESAKVPILHSKWMKIYTIEKAAFLQLKKKEKKLYLERWELYTQGPTKDQIKAGEKLPPKGMILKNEVDKYLDADDTLAEMRLRVEMQQEKVDLLENIVKMINNRSYQIHNALEFLRWTAGH